MGLLRINFEKIKNEVPFGYASMRDEIFTFKINNVEVKETIYDWAYSFAKDNLLELNHEQILHIIEDVIRSINNQILQISWKS